MHFNGTAAERRNDQLCADEHEVYMSGGKSRKSIVHQGQRLGAAFLGTPRWSRKQGVVWDTPALKLSAPHGSAEVSGRAERRGKLSGIETLPNFGMVQDVKKGIHDPVE